ncbi:DUF1326 domain-containing protein [Roseibium salinum]|nr:DUF1326 domain-containing protein [Roseibium salinum]
MKDWSIQARELANCNCNFGCPCQFGVLPTTGNCEAVVVYDIEKKATMATPGSTD